MRKILLTAIVLASFFTVKAQNQVSVGLELGMPFADLSTFHGFGIGATAKLHHSLKGNLQLTGTTGYMSFAGKDGAKAFGFLPLKAGLRFSVADNLFIEPEVGLWFGNNGWGTSFAYGAGIYKAWNSFDLGVRLEGSSKNSANAWFLGLRGAYKFDLGK